MKSDDTSSAHVLSEGCMDDLISNPSTKPSTNTQQQGLIIITPDHPLYAFLLSNKQQPISAQTTKPVNQQIGKS